MPKALLQRVLYTLPVIWLVVSLVFLLIHLVPGDPIQQMLGEGAPPADIQATRHAYGLDAPLGEQYLHYWKGVLHGDLGPSFRYNQSVTRLLTQRYPYTLQLTLASLFVAIVLSIPAGVRSAQRRNRWDDRLLSVVSLFGLSFPNFALGPILILLFAIKLGWLPVSGAGSFANLILPAITMGGAHAGGDRQDDSHEQRCQRQLQRVGIALGQQARNALVVTERWAEVAVEDSFPVVDVLLA